MDFRGKQFDQKEASIYATIEPLHLLNKVDLPFVLATTGVERVAGALGAKLAGAGNGGTIIVLWPCEDRTFLQRTLLDAGASACYRPGIYQGATLES